MTLKLTKLIAFIGIVIASIIGLNMFRALPVSAVGNVCNSSASDEVKAAAGCPEYNTAGDDLPKIIINILNAIIGVAGVIAVIFVIIGGVQYITSAGDPGKTKKAKDTILYSVIGLIICVFAFAIVNFVISDIIKNNSNKEDKEDTEESIIIHPQKDIAFFIN